jgi:hypothetical protein
MMRASEPPVKARRPEIFPNCVMILPPPLEASVNAGPHRHQLCPQLGVLREIGGIGPVVRNRTRPIIEL